MIRVIGRNLFLRKQSKDLTTSVSRKHTEWYYNNIVSLRFPYLGSLQELYPDADYDALTLMRLSNWTVFKQSCDINKISSDVVRLPKDRLEMYKPLGDYINITSGQELNIDNSGTIVMYPFTPRDSGDDKVFSLAHSTTFNANGHWTQESGVLYETYFVTLRKGSVVNAIEILGDIRPDFWSDLEVGQPFWYAWAFETTGRVTTVSSWDEANSIVYVTDNINAPVTNDMSGTWVRCGRYFKESIPVADYNLYGQYWYNDLEIQGMNLVYAVDNTGVTASDTITINFTDCNLENFVQAIQSSSNSKIAIDFIGDCRIYNHYIGVGQFTQSVASGATFSFDDLLIEQCGKHVAGAVSYFSNDHRAGSGTYLHPNVQVTGRGELIVKENIAVPFRQYSSSGPKPVPDGAATYFKKITGINNVEDIFLLSNSMPTVIDELHHPVYVGHNTVINGGEVAFGTNGQTMPEDDTDYTIEVNDSTIIGITAGWSASRNTRTDININNGSEETSTGEDLDFIFKSEVDYLKVINVEGFTITRADPVTEYIDGENRPASPTYANALVRTDSILNVNINNLQTDRYWAEFFIHSGTMNTETGHITKVIITNSELLHTAILGSTSTSSSQRYINDCVEMSNTLVYNDISRRYLFVAFFKVTPKDDTSPTKSINATLTVIDPKTLATSSASFSNVLQIDSGYDKYPVNTGTISHIAFILRGCLVNNTARPMSMNGCYNGNIQITAVGGSIVFTKFDAVTNQDGNIINDFTLLVGQTALLTLNRKHRFTTAADTTVTNEVIGTGDGVVNTFAFGLINRSITLGTVTVTIGGVTGTDDGNGNITGTGIAYGFIDYFGGSIYIRTTAVIGNGVQGLCTYNVPSGLRNVGSWTVSLIP